MLIDMRPAARRAIDLFYFFHWRGFLTSSCNEETIYFMTEWGQSLDRGSNLRKPRRTNPGAWFTSEDLVQVNRCRIHSNGERRRTHFRWRWIRLRGSAVFSTRPHVRSLQTAAERIQIGIDQRFADIRHEKRHRRIHTLTQTHTHTQTLTLNKFHVRVLLAVGRHQPAAGSPATLPKSQPLRSDTSSSYEYQQAVEKSGSLSRRRGRTTAPVAVDRRVLPPAAEAEGIASQRDSTKAVQDAATSRCGRPLGRRQLRIQLARTAALSTGAAVFARIND